MTATSGTLPEIIMFLCLLPALFFILPYLLKNMYKGLCVVFQYPSHQLHLQHYVPTLVVVATPSKHTMSAHV